MTSEDDVRLLEFGIGFTDIVKRTTPCSSDLSRSEIRDGASVLLSKIQQFRPRIAVFNGKGIYEIFVNCFLSSPTGAPGALAGALGGALGGGASCFGNVAGTRKQQLVIGKQPHCIPNTDTLIFVMPSSSARCAQLPRAVDKVPIFSALKKLRDSLRGDLPVPVSDDELVFPDLELISAPVEPEARCVRI